MLEIFSTLSKLAECVCEVTKELGDTCFCGVITGDAISALGAADQSQSYVRLATVFAGESVNTSVTASGFPCGPQTLRASIEVGWFTCIEITEEFPEETLEAESVEKQLHAMEVLLEAITCCEWTSQNYTLDSWEPIGPENGLLGGIWNITLEL